MSEYQYYEFQAIDRPLSEKEMRELRALSSRARITPTSFVNVYNFGDFKGNPSKLMEKCFDAFLYLANWGTHRFMLRFPRKILDLDTASIYCMGECASARVAGDYVILSFESEDEDGDWVEDEGLLSSLIPLRAELARGDNRCLYLAWLLCAQNGEFDDDDTEPPVPPKLGSLTSSERSFVEFLRIDEDLIEVAANASASSAVAQRDRTEIEAWIHALAESEKDVLLFRLIEGEDPHLGTELMRRFIREKHSREPAESSARERTRRTVGELLSAAQALAEEKQRMAEKKAAAEKARREREAAVAREKYLDGLAQGETTAWLKVDELIATKQPARYDEAITLLVDLRDLAVRRSKTDEFRLRWLELCEQHAKKPSLLHRMKKAGF